MSIKDFHILGRLGEGAYSSVFKVKRLNDKKEYALKKVGGGSLAGQNGQAVGQGEGERSQRGAHPGEHRVGLTLTLTLTLTPFAATPT